jgi:ribosomal protein L13E
MHHIKATITAPNGKQKQGKGFSRNEIKEAGISKQKARQLKFPIDDNRKSTHPQNVDAIKAHLPKQKS